MAQILSISAMPHFRQPAKSHEEIRLEDRARTGVEGGAVPIPPDAAAPTPGAAVVKTGPFAGMSQGDAEASLNVAFLRDMGEFLAVEPDVDLRSCMQEYRLRMSEIQGDVGGGGVVGAAAFKSPLAPVAEGSGGAPVTSPATGI
jgi:hypothetical protein